MSIDFNIVESGIAVITINRPERRNAMDAEHYSALSRAWERVRDDPDVRVAIVTGAGDVSFSAGADLKSYIGREAELREFWHTQKDMLLNRGLEVWKPVIAAVNGYCLAGGMTLLLATDIRVAAPHATFALSEVRRGIIAGNGGTQRTIAQLPKAIAMELLLAGTTMDAQTAERWGLVNRVVPLPQLMETALAYARAISANAPLAVQAAKELALRAHEAGIGAGLRMEQAIQRTLLASADAREGATAFSEKRPARFVGA